MPLEAEQTPGFSYPPHVTQYHQSHIGPLNPRDTESNFTLVSPASRPIYTLPGIPFDQSVNPTDKLLIANLSSSPFGICMVGPPDYLKLPIPTLADFRAVIFNSIGDFARVLWTGTLWTLYETGGPSVQVAVVGQTFPVFPT